MFNSGKKSDNRKRLLLDELGSKMNGNTLQFSHRLIQQAFNRPKCFPMVLIAQSVVGREGLNLHKTYKTVVLIHPKWNSGVVEQRLGRVDRVSSHWCKKLDADLARGTIGHQLFRIEVFPIVFQGTYNEHNWSVLRRHWDDRRAQLHGVIIPEREAESDQGGPRILAKLKQYAPDFSSALCIQKPRNKMDPQKGDKQ